MDLKDYYSFLLCTVKSDFGKLISQNFVSVFLEDNDIENV